jgi:hypothetical protein
VFKLYGMDNSSSIEFLLYKPNVQVRTFYSDIKYDLIPFLILLNNKYDIENYYGSSRRLSS